MDFYKLVNDITILDKKRTLIEADTEFQQKYGLSQANMGTGTNWTSQAYNLPQQQAPAQQDDQSGMLTLQSINQAVAQYKTDEDTRASILSSLAKQNDLPGLFDPVTGNFVDIDGEINDAPDDEDSQTLANMGLVPTNAKFDSAGMFDNEDTKNNADQAMRDMSTMVDRVNMQGQQPQAQQNYDPLADFDKIDKLGELMSQYIKLKGGVENAPAAQPKPQETYNYQPVAQQTTPIAPTQAAPAAKPAMKAYASPGNATIAESLMSYFGYSMIDENPRSAPQRAKPAKRNTVLREQAAPEWTQQDPYQLEKNDQAAAPLRAQIEALIKELSTSQNPATQRLVQQYKARLEQY